MPVSPFIIKQFLNRELRDSAKAKCFTPEAIDAKLATLDPPPTFHTTPRHHQKICFLLGLDRPKYGLLLDPGLGKSCITLQLFDYRRTIGVIDRMLVLVPNVANLNQWVQETKKHTPSLTCQPLDVSGREARETVLVGSSDIVVATYAGFLSLCCKGKRVWDEEKEEWKTKGWERDEKKVSLLRAHFQMITLDESSVLLGDPNSLLSRTLRQFVKGIRYRYLLTGTPFGKDPAKVWAQFNVVDDGETFGESMGLFRSAFFKGKPGWFGGTDWTFDEKKEEAFNRTLRHGAIRYHQDECLDLPELVETRRTVTFSSETWAYYSKLIDELKAARGNFQLIDNVFYRMRGLVAGFLAYKDSEGDRGAIVFKDNPKLDALVGLLDEIPADRKVIVFVDLIKTGDIVSDGLKKAKVTHARLYSGTKDKGAEVTKFQTNPKCRALVSSKSGGFGLNLQVANYVVFYETPTSPDVRRQMIARVHRMGQDRTCFVWDLVIKSSIDGKILRSIEAGLDLMTVLVEGREYDQL